MSGPTREQLDRIERQWTSLEEVIRDLLGSPVRDLAHRMDTVRDHAERLNESITEALRCGNCLDFSLGGACESCAAEFAHIVGPLDDEFDCWGDR